MRITDLMRCERCGLEWVADDPGTCPRCRRFSTLPTEPVIVGGHKVQVRSVVLFGDETGLADKKVRRGLEKVDLGCKCPHGFIHHSLCPECSEMLITDKVTPEAPPWGW